MSPFPVMENAELLHNSKREKGKSIFRENRHENAWLNTVKCLMAADLYTVRRIKCFRFGRVKILRLQSTDPLR